MHAGDVQAGVVHLVLEGLVRAELVLVADDAYPDVPAAVRLDLLAVPGVARLVGPRGLYRAVQRYVAAFAGALACHGVDGVLAAKEPGSAVAVALPSDACQGCFWNENAPGRWFWTLESIASPLE